MTFEELEALIRAGASDRVVDDLCRLNSSERRVLAKPVYQLFRSVERGQEPNLWQAGRYEALRLAVLGTNPKANALRVPCFYLWDEPLQSLLFRLLSETKPSWLGVWVETRLGDDWGLPWTFAWQLWQDRVIERPTGLGYAKAFDHHFYQLGPQREAALLQRPELLEADIWYLFAYETNTFWADWSHYAKTRDGQPIPSWRETVVNLVSTAKLSRVRVLQECLEAIGRDSKQNVLGGFIKLFDALKPTLDEIEHHQHELCDLLTRRNSRSAAWSLKWLRKLDKDGRLSAERFLDCIQPALQLPTKQTAIDALKLLGSLVERDADLGPITWGVAATALVHPKAEVQEAALEFLNRWPEQTAELVASKKDFMSPTVTAPTEEIKIEAVCLDWDDLNEPWLGFAGVDSEARNFGSLAYRFGDVPILTELEEIRPLESFSELLLAASHAMEKVDSGDEIERLIDGLSRLGAERPLDFPEATAALSHRIRKVQRGEVLHGIGHGWEGLCLALEDLLQTWVDGRLRRTMPGQFTLPGGFYHFLRARLDEVAARLLNRVSRPLLAAPTHRGGWLAPAVFVSRFLAELSAGREPGKFDLMAALLRLAPDGRKEALNRIQDLGEPYGRLLRYALGGGDQARSSDPSHWWLAAARGRDPFGLLTDWPWPTQKRPVGYRWSAEMVESKSFEQTHRNPKILVEAEAGLPVVQGFLTKVVEKVKTKVKGGPTEAHYPTLVTPEVSLERSHYWQYLDLSADWLVEWQLQIWPAQHDAMLVLAIRSLVDGIDCQTRANTPHHAYLQGGFERDRPWGELRILTMWLSLLSKDHQAQVTATEAWHEGIETGQADLELAVPVLLRIAECPELIKANRLGQCVRTLSSGSVLHAHWSFSVLDALLGYKGSEIHGVHHLLETQLEIALCNGFAPSAQARVYLESVSKKSKSGKLAQRLLQERPECPEVQEAVKHLALSHRLATVRRWQSGSG